MAAAAVAVCGTAGVCGKCRRRGTRLPASAPWPAGHRRRSSDLARSGTRAAVDGGDAPGTAADRELGTHRQHQFGGDQDRAWCQVAVGVGEELDLPLGRVLHRRRAGAEEARRIAARIGGGPEVQVGELLVEGPDGLLLEDAENALEARELVRVHVDEVAARRQNRRSSGARGSAPVPDHEVDQVRRGAAPELAAGGGAGGSGTATAFLRPRDQVIRKRPRKLQFSLPPPCAPDSAPTRWTPTTRQLRHASQPVHLSPRRSTCCASSSRPGPRSSTRPSCTIASGPAHSWWTRT